MQQESMGILACIPTFIAALQAKNRRPRTIDSYMRDVRLFATWFKGIQGQEPCLTDVTPRDVRSYRTHLQQECQFTPNTVNRRLASLRVFLEWAVEAGHLTINPAARIHNVKLVEPAFRWLDQTEQQRLLKAVEQTVQITETESGEQVNSVLQQVLRDRALVLTLLNTGLQVLELTQLTLADLSLSERIGSVHIRDGKGGTARTVPLNRSARNALASYLATRLRDRNQHLFPGQQDQPISGRQILRILKKYARLANLEPEIVTAQTLRHSFGKNLVNAGVPIDQVAKLMGHANLNTTRRYMTSEAGDLHQAVEKVTPDEQLKSFLEEMGNG